MNGLFRTKGDRVLIAGLLLITVFLFMNASMVLADEIHDAVFEKDISKVKSLIKKNPKLINSKDYTGRTPLHCAAAMPDGTYDIAVYLINAKSSVNGKDREGNTPIFAAANLGNVKIVKLLLSKGAKADAVNNNGRTPLFFVSTVGRWKPEAKALTAITNLLIKAGADVNKKDNFGWTPLHEAAFYGQTEVAKILIDKGAEVNAKDKKGNTPLSYSRQNQHKATSEMIERNGGI